MESLTGGTEALFDLVDHDSFGTHPNDQLPDHRLLLSGHIVEKNPVLWKLLSHLRARGGPRNDDGKGA